jgi:hypothetical protein
VYTPTSRQLQYNSQQQFNIIQEGESGQVGNLPPSSHSPYIDESKFYNGNPVLYKELSYKGPPSAGNSQDSDIGLGDMVMADLKDTINLRSRQTKEHLLATIPALQGLLPTGGSVIYGDESSSSTNIHKKIAQDRREGRSRGTGSILMTGRSLVTMPHASYSTSGEMKKKAYEQKKMDFKDQLMEYQYARVRAPTMSHTANPNSNPNPSSNLIRPVSTPVMRYRDGEWQVQQQLPSQVSEELKQESVSELGERLSEIERDRQQTELPKWYL